METSRAQRGGGGARARATAIPRRQPRNFRGEGCRGSPWRREEQGAFFRRLISGFVGRSWRFTGARYLIRSPGSAIKREGTRKSIIITTTPANVFIQFERAVFQEVWWQFIPLV